MRKMILFFIVMAMVFVFGGQKAYSMSYAHTACVTTHRTIINSPCSLYKVTNGDSVMYFACPSLQTKYYQVEQVNYATALNVKNPHAGVCVTTIRRR